MSLVLLAVSEELSLMSSARPEPSKLPYKPDLRLYSARKKYGIKFRQPNIFYLIKTIHGRIKSAF